MKLYEPLGTLKPVTEDLWIVDGPIVRMSLSGLSFPFPTRMTVIRLGSGALFLHSPIALTEGLRAEIHQLGPVRHLVFPKKIHYANLATWKTADPDAIAWASPRVRERAASQRISVTFDRDLGDAAEPEWAADVDQLMFCGSRFMDEVVFLHRKSRTLLLADLIENFELSRVGFVQRLLIRLSGNADPDGKAPIDLRMTFAGHKQQARECLRRMEAWRPERIILGHGRWYQSGGERELQRAFCWLLPDSVQ